MCEMVSVGFGAKQKQMQKEYGQALSKHVPLALQQVLLNIGSALLRLKRDEFPKTMVEVASVDDKFKNWLWIVRG